MSRVPAGTFIIDDAPQPTISVDGLASITGFKSSEDNECPFFLHQFEITEAFQFSFLRFTTLPMKFYLFTAEEQEKTKTTPLD